MDVNVLLIPMVLVQQYMSCFSFFLLTVTVFQKLVANGIQLDVLNAVKYIYLIGFCVVLKWCLAKHILIG